jgi:hypothetical protein
MSDKVMRPSAFQPQSRIDFVYASYVEQLEPGVEFSDLFNPVFWIHVRGRLRQRDIIRLIAHDNSFDVFLTVQALPAGGAVMRFLSGDPGPKVGDPFKFIQELREARAIPTIAPMDPAGKPLVRVQFIPATQWRLLGIDGSEVKKDMATREEAEEAMGVYLKDINMRLPTEEESAAYAAAHSTPPQKQ